MSSAAPRWMARIGGLLSMMATTILVLVQWRTWSGLLEAGVGLLFCVGLGVSMGMLWTFAQALIHTRLGSQPMFPEQTPSAPLPALRVGRWIVLVTGLLLLWNAVEIRSLLFYIYEDTGSIAQTVLAWLESILLVHLWPRLVLGCGLGFTLALLQQRLVADDSLTPAVLDAVSDGQRAGSSQPAAAAHRSAQGIAQG